MKMTCKECVLRNGNNCLVARRMVEDLSSAACPWGRRADSIRTCEKCGQQFESLLIDMTSNTPHFICEACLKSYNTCNSCSQQIFCGFSADQRTPDYVMRQFRNGNQIIQTQIKNPDKIEIYCKGCKCWNKDNEYCMKEWGYCKNYREKIRWDG